MLAPAVPKIKTTDQDYVTDAGKPIVMAVPYSAYPTAEADWLFDQKSLSKDLIYTSADKTELRLKDPKKADEGRYKILIKNKHGGGEAFINLQVIGRSSKHTRRWCLYSNKMGPRCPCFGDPTLISNISKLKQSIFLN